MKLSGKTEEKVFMEETGFSEDMTIPVQGQQKENRFGIMFGLFNDGLRLVLKARKLPLESSESLIKFQKAMFNKYEMTFEHGWNFKLFENLYRINFDYNQSFKYSKFVSYEKAFSVSLQDLDQFPDWTLRLSSEIRKNVFDSSSCFDYFKFHSLPTNKYSLSLSYMNLGFNDLTQM